MLLAFPSPPDCVLCVAVEFTFVGVHGGVAAGVGTEACPDCNKSYSTRAGLLRHVARTHSGLRPYPCKEPGCGQSFAILTDLTEHSHRHTKPFGCDVCQRRFGKKHSLDEHMYTHTGKPFGCTLCPFRVRKHYELRKHMARRHDHRDPSGP